MNLILRVVALGVCGVLCACQTVDPKTSDTTPPGTNLLIKSYGQPDLEVQNQPGANVGANLGAIPASNSSLDFSVLATATDNESGIREIKLSMTRMVCYRASSGVIAQAYSATVVRKQSSYSGSSVPRQASLSDTGVIKSGSTADENLLVWVNANQIKSVGVGLHTLWSMEAKNGNNQTSYSRAITIGAGDTSC